MSARKTFFLLLSAVFCNQPTRSNFCTGTTQRLNYTFTVKYKKEDITILHLVLHYFATKAPLFQPTLNFICLKFTIDFPLDVQKTQKKKNVPSTNTSAVFFHHWQQLRQKLTLCAAPPKSTRLIQRLWNMQNVVFIELNKKSWVVYICGSFKQNILYDWFLR